MIPAIELFENSDIFENKVIYFSSKFISYAPHVYPNLNGPHQNLRNSQFPTNPNAMFTTFYITIRTNFVIIHSIFQAFEHSNPSLPPLPSTTHLLPSSFRDTHHPIPLLALTPITPNHHHSFSSFHSIFLSHLSSFSSFAATILAFGQVTSSLLHTSSICPQFETFILTINNQQIYSITVRHHSTNIPMNHASNF